MKTEISVKEYIYGFLNGLGLGPVFEDREVIGDTQTMKATRTYIVVEYPNGIDDEGPWFRASVGVCLGCKDKDRFKPEGKTLANMCDTLLKKIPHNNMDVGVNIVSCDFVDDYAFGTFSHECRYVLDVYASK